MNKLVTKILKESGVDAKITRDNKRPKFRVKNGQLTLEGIVSSSKYTMKITDTKGDIIDELSVSVKDGNDIVNRINESILTLNKLSPIYDNQIKLKEDEEFEEIPDVEPGDIKGALNAITVVRDNIMDLADNTDQILDYYDDEDVEDKQKITGFVAALYDLAIDMDEYKEDKIEELNAPKEESFKVKKSSKSASRIALEHITIAQASLKGQPGCESLYNALKDIKSELTVRGIK
jgi:hypothetical protein